MEVKRSRSWRTVGHPISKNLTTYSMKRHTKLRGLRPGKAGEDISGLLYELCKVVGPIVIPIQLAQAYQRILKISNRSVIRSGRLR